MTHVSVAAPVGAAPAGALVPDVAAVSLAATCGNCGDPGSGTFCAGCGQRHSSGRLTGGAFLHEFISQVVELDHGLLHTLVDLIRRPGEMIRGYIDGRRRAYTSPVTFVLLGAALSLLLGELNPKLKAAREALISNASPAMHSLFSDAQLAVYARNAHELMNSKVLMLLAIVPPVLLMVRFFFRKHRFNTAELGVFVCYTIGATTFISTVLAIPFAIAGNLTAETNLAYVVGITYSVYAAVGVFGRSFSTVWRMVVSLVLGELIVGLGLVLLPFLVAR